jgi:hypothetical protein
MSLKPHPSPDCEITIGSKKVFLSGRRFKEHTEVVQADCKFKHTKGFNTSQFSCTTIFVKNIGHSAAIVFVTVSPNNIDYVVDGIEYEVQPGKTIALVARFFSKYVHIAYKAVHPSKSTNLKMIFQAQV